MSRTYVLGPREAITTSLSTGVMGICSESNIVIFQGVHFLLYHGIAHFNVIKSHRCLFVLVSGTKSPESIVWAKFGQIDNLGLTTSILSCPIFIWLYPVDFSVYTYSGFFSSSRSYNMTGVTAPFRWVACWFIQLALAWDSVFAIVFWCFSRVKKLLGRT